MASSMLIGILITFLVIILVLYLVQRLPLDARMTATPRGLSTSWMTPAICAVIASCVCRR